MQVNPLVVASASPRRSELLTSCGIPYRTVNHEFDEDSVVEKDPGILAREIALGKAQSVACKPEFQGEYVLGVDTVVVYGEHVLGKPADRDEALKFIRLLEGKKHRVISGIALVNREEDIALAEYAESYVTFGTIDDKFLKNFLDNNHWRGYAGGYAIQGVFSLVIREIRGSYTNIVGLPTETLYRMLNQIHYPVFGQ